MSPASQTWERESLPNLGSYSSGKLRRPDHFGASDALRGEYNEYQSYQTAAIIEIGND